MKALHDHWTPTTYSLLTVGYSSKKIQEERNQGPQFKIQTDGTPVHDQQQLHLLLITPTLVRMPII